MAQKTYSAAEQAQISQRYPGLEWVNGQPYTRKYNGRDENGSPVTDPMTGQPVEDDGSYSLVPAHTDEGGIPWWMPAAMIGGPAAAQGIGALAGMVGGGAAGAGASAASSGAPALTGVGVGGNAGIQAALSGGLTSGGAAGGSGILSTLSKYAPLAQNLSSVLGGAAKGSADTAAAKSVFDLNRYGTEQNAQMDQGRLDLQRKQFDESSEASRMKRALIGTLLGNVQDVNVSVPGIKNASVTGGMRPSALGQNGKDLAALMVKLASEKAQAGNQYQGGQMVTPPQFSGGGNSFLNSAALAASILGTPGYNQRKPVQT